MHIQCVSVAAPGGFLGFLETGQILLAINFFAKRSVRIISDEDSR